MIIKNPEAFTGECFAFVQKNIVLKENGTKLSFADIKELQMAFENADIWAEKEYNLCSIFTKDVNTVLPKGYILKELRAYTYQCTEEESFHAFRAKGLATWTMNTRYCPSCGKPLSTHESLTALECKECGRIIFPRIEPCVIVLVNRGDKMLLAQHTQRDRKMYACLAGFMETGENAEQAVRREVMEETGLKIKNIKYFGTQSWPFPSQLMIAFTAEWESGELNLQEEELCDAGWFGVDECVDIPSPGSIAYEMISAFKERVHASK